MSCRTGVCLAALYSNLLACLHYNATLCPETREFRLMAALLIVPLDSLSSTLHQDGTRLQPCREFRLVSVRSCVQLVHGGPVEGPPLLWDNEGLSWRDGPCTRCSYRLPMNPGPPDALWLCRARTRGLHRTRSTDIGLTHLVFGKPGPAGIQHVVRIPSSSRYQPPQLNPL
jgi:hypothetical protein